MQKDTVIHAISSVMLDPAGGNTPTALRNINEVIVNGQNLGLNGYLDIGLYDTMADLWVNFLGAVVFSVIGFFYIKHKGKGRVASRFIPSVRKKKHEFYKIVEEQEKIESETQKNKDKKKSK